MFLNTLEKRLDLHNDIHKPSLFIDNNVYIDYHVFSSLLRKDVDW